MENLFRENRFIFQEKPEPKPPVVEKTTRPAETEVSKPAEKVEDPEKALLNKLKPRIQSVKTMLGKVIGNKEAYTTALVTSAELTQEELAEVEALLAGLEEGGEDITASDLTTFTERLEGLEGVTEASEVSNENIVKNAELKTKITEQRKALADKTSASESGDQQFNAKRLWAHLGLDEGAVSPAVKAAVKTAYASENFQEYMDSLLEGAGSKLDDIDGEGITENADIAEKLKAATGEIGELTLEKFAAREDVLDFTSTIDSITGNLQNILEKGQNGKYCTEAKEAAESDAIAAIGSSDIELFNGQDHLTEILNGYTADVLNASGVACDPIDVMVALSKPLGEKRSEKEQAIVSKIMEKQKELRAGGVMVQLSGESDATNYKANHKLDWHQGKAAEFKTLKELLKGNRIRGENGDEVELNESIGKIDEYLAVVAGGDEKAINKFVKDNKSIFAKGGNLFDAASCVRRARESKAILTGRADATLNPVKDLVYMNRSAEKGKDNRRNGINLASTDNEPNPEPTPELSEETKAAAAEVLGAIKIAAEDGVQKFDERLKVAQAEAQVHIETISSEAQDLIPNTPLSDVLPKVPEPAPDKKPIQAALQIGENVIEGAKNVIATGKQFIDKAEDAITSHITKVQEEAEKALSECKDELIEHIVDSKLYAASGAAKRAIYAINDNYQTAKANLSNKAKVMISAAGPILRRLLAEVTEAGMNETAKRAEVEVKSKVKTCVRKIQRGTESSLRAMRNIAARHVALIPISELLTHDAVPKLEEVNG